MGMAGKGKNTIKTGVAAATTMAVAGAMANKVFAKGSDKIKVGLLGCGGRGNGAIRQCLNADPGIEVIATADLFHNKAKGTADKLMGDKKYKGRVNIKADHVFSGFDCHVKLAECEADLLCMATAPAFRGRQLMAAIKNGKHVFTEKPVGTDPAGLQEIIAASELAKEKNLSIVCGTQRRHEFSRVELMKQIHAGKMGEPVSGQCYWYGRGIWYRGYSKGWSELEWQCNNWYHFVWLSGDQILEQHIHNIDVMNWVFNGPPEKITAVGGRGVRDYSGSAKGVAKALGNESDWQKYNGDINDHIFAEFKYPNGGRALSLSGHGPGAGGVGETAIGTKGYTDCRGRIWDLDGKEIWGFKGKNVNGQQQEHNDMIAGIRSGKLLNEGVRIAESCLTAAGARIAAFTGQEIDFKWLRNECKMKLVPSHEELMKAKKGYFYPLNKGNDKLK